MKKTIDSHPANITLGHELQKYAPISLSNMSEVALLNRTDTKYVLSKYTLHQIIPNLAQAYSTLTIDGQRSSQYRTLYFDSPTFALYHRHHAGILDRYKVRSREYVDSQLAFLEVKHKTNKGRTIKERIQTPELAASFGRKSTKFLHQVYPYDAAELEPKLWVDYRRVTLVSRSRKERVTIDLDLCYSWEDQFISLPHLAIVEIKQDGVSHDSDMAQQLRQHHARATGFSKYCVGISLIYPAVKHNNFKPKLRIVEKLAQEQSHVYTH